MGVFNPVTKVDITPIITDDWVTIDLSAYIPPNATGVTIHCDNILGGNRAIGLRHNASTDNRFHTFQGHFWGFTGVDANKWIEVYVADGIEIYLVGYFGSGATFFTNAFDKSRGSTGWGTIDLSVECPNATAIIVEIVDALFVPMALRKNGSTDIFFGYVGKHKWAIVPCDSGQIIDTYIGNLSTDFFIVGYITDGATFFTNAFSHKVAVANVYEDLDLSVECPGANMILVEACITTGIITTYAIRKKGVIEDDYKTNRAHAWSLVECNSNQIIEIKATRTDDFFRIIGYSVVEGGYIWTEETKFHYINENGDEIAFQGFNTSFDGEAGHLFVEGTYLHYTDENGDERRQRGYKLGATGVESGHIWIEGVNFHYIDANGDERYLPIQGGMDAPLLDQVLLG